jgi:chromosomal replication initiation ATPase DnaA
MATLNEVYKTNGVPTFTFVPPKEFARLENNLRTPGRPLVIEGPSGIGKTTAIDRALSEAGLADRASKLSARRKEDVEYIAELPHLREIGVVVVDDFHKLEPKYQEQIADLVKVLADRESATEAPPVWSLV